MSLEASLRVAVVVLLTGASVLFGAGCSAPRLKKPAMPVLEGPLLPKGVFFGVPPYRYQSMGVVRASKTYPTLHLEMTDELDEAYCKKVFAEAARELLVLAKENGGDGVADVHSVVYLADGRRETYDKPECTDDGEEGEVLVQGIAIKWVRTGVKAAPKPAPSPASSPSPVPTPSSKP